MRSTEAEAQPRLRFSIKTKLFLVVLISFGLLTALIVWYVSLLASNAAQNSAQQTLQRSERVLTTRLSSRFDSISTVGQSVAEDPAIRPWIYAADSKELQARMSDLREQHGFDLLMLTDAQGSVLARSDKPTVIGSSAARSSLFREALGGSPARGFMKRGEQVLQIVALPVRDNAAPELIRGSLGIAYLLSGELADEIKELTGGEVQFFTMKPLAGKTFSAFPTQGTLGSHSNELRAFLLETRALLGELLPEASGAAERRLTLADEEFLGSFYPLKTHNGQLVGIAAMLASRTAVLAPYRKIIKGCLLAGLLGVLLAGALAFGIAQGVSRPIIELVGITNRIRDGYFPPYRFGKRGDEVGVLQRAVYQMGQSLKRKVELEEYLASFADAIELEFPPESKPAAVRQKNDQADPMLRGNGALFDERYRVDGVLGAGGMGKVYRAHDVALDEAVALKLLHGSELSAEDEALFKQEIKLARKISHPNIVRTHDFGRFQGNYYISMEYVPGFTLQQFVAKNNPLDLGIGVIMARQICAALSAAHAQGVVHRDLKASNIIISRRGVLKIMDFGIAIAIRSQFELEDDPNADTVNEVSDVHTFGTPLYMAPEQIQGKQQDQRVDIYAMGVLLYFLFSGGYPFSGKTVMELASQHLAAAVPDIRQVRPDTPALLKEIIERALAKDRDQRFGSAVEMGYALGGIPIPEGELSSFGKAATDDRKQTLF